MEEQPRFVVQLHDARRLHYDFRLEAGGVLVSWAVPRGPSYDPRIKRLAVHVGDHEMEHRHYEGVRPGARHGSGAVLVWDEGTYRNLTNRDGREVTISEGLEAGHLSFWLEGVKLRGGWSLTRTGRSGRGARDPWLLVKRSDDQAHAGVEITAVAPQSVRTGRLLADLQALVTHE